MRATYLDSYGRTVVVLRKANLVEEHMQEFTLTYEFSQITLLREPFMLVSFFAVILLAAIVINRIDLSIVSTKPVKAKQQ